MDGIHRCSPGGRADPHARSVDLCSMEIPLVRVRIARTGLRSNAV